MDGAARSEQRNEKETELGIQSGMMSAEDGQIYDNFL